MERPLPPLPYPVTFVCNATEAWQDLFASPDQPVPDPNAIHSRIASNEECWVILTYLQLKRRGLEVSISRKFVPGAICVASALDFGIRKLTFSSFVVGCRSDGPKPALCDIAIVQNPENVESPTDVLIPHWPQPGLIPRSPDRGTDLKTIVFKGSEVNLYESFRSPEFRQALNKLGMQLVIDGRPDKGPVTWNDYSTADLVLAVRDLTEEDARVKPASKLVNAWMAGVPALLGPEPAFRHLKKTDLDYIEVSTPEAVLAAVQRLRDQPDLYQQMITNGLQRAEAFSPDCIAQIWRDTLAGIVAERYELWRRKMALRRLGRFFIRAIQQKQAASKAAYNRIHGYRPISGQHT